MSIMDSALNLMRRLPPQEIEANLTNLVKLCPNLNNDLLNSVDQPLKIARDHEIGKDFLISEFNNNESSYRSPWTNKYYPTLTNGYEPPNYLRSLEIQANYAFEEYVKLYFNGGLSSVYFWDLNDKHFAGAILIKKEHNEQGVNCCWDSIHLIEVTEDNKEKCLYKLTSTLIIWIETNNAESGLMKLSSNVMKQKEACLNTVGSGHCVNIGKMIEEMENQLKDSIKEIHFDKTINCLNRLRIFQANSDDNNARKTSISNELFSKLVLMKKN